MKIIIDISFNDKYDKWQMEIYVNGKANTLFYDRDIEFVCFRTFTHINYLIIEMARQKVEDFYNEAHDETPAYCEPEELEESLEYENGAIR